MRLSSIRSATALTWRNVTLDGKNLGHDWQGWHDWVYEQIHITPGEHRKVGSYTDHYKFKWHKFVADLEVDNAILQVLYEMADDDGEVVVNITETKFKPKPKRNR